MFNSFIKYPHLLFIWLFPIIVAASTGRLRVNYGIDSTIVYLLGASVGFGILYYFLYLFRISLSKNIILIILILFPMMLISDYSEYRIVVVLASYALIVHAISRKFPSILWDQYYIFCMILSLMTIIDVASYLIIDEAIFTYRDKISLIEQGFIVLPKVSPIFDEMAHQAFFIMPAAILAFQKNYKHFLLLSFGVLMVHSQAALLLFPLLLVVFNFNQIKFTLRNFNFTILFLIILIFIFLNSLDAINSKLLPFLNTEWLLNREKGISGLNLFMSFDYLRYVDTYDLLIGFGYFGYSESLQYIFERSIFYDYYMSQGALKEISMVGLTNFLMKFGLIVSIIVILLIHNAKKNALDKLLYKVSITIVLVSMLKNSHSIDSFVHLFFVFGLSWSCRKEITSVINS
jgi:hypothetical protein